MWMVQGMTGRMVGVLRRHGGRVGKVNQGVYAGGDQVLFRCGGVWSEELEVTSSGSAGHVITYGWYGSGARPVLEAGGELSGVERCERGRWTSAGSNLWTFSSSRHPGRLWLSGVEYGISGSGAGGSTTPNSTYRWYDDGAGHLTSVGERQSGAGLQQYPSGEPGAGGVE
jgi:hypothetical protein